MSLLNNPKTNLMLHIEVFINSQFDSQLVRFKNDFSTLDIDGKTIKTWKIFKRDTDSVQKEFSNTAKLVQKECKKFNTSIDDVSYCFFDMDDKLTSILDNYNSVLSKAFNESSLLDQPLQIENDAFQYGIITNSLTTAVAFAVVSSLHQLDKEVSAYKKQHTAQQELVNTIQSKWRSIFNSTVLKYAESIYSEAKITLLKACCTEIDIDFEEYTNWKNALSLTEKNNILSKYKTTLQIDKRKQYLDVQEQKLKELNLRLNDLTQGGFFSRIKNRNEINQIRGQIHTVESVKQSLTTNVRISAGMVFTLITQIESFAGNTKSSIIYRDRFNRDLSIKLEFDENIWCYRVYHEQAGEIGQLGKSFTSQYGAFRKFAGTIVHWDNPVVSGGASGDISLMKIRPNVQISLYEQ